MYIPPTQKTIDPDNSYIHIIVIDLDEAEPCSSEMEVTDPEPTADIDELEPAAVLELLLLLSQNHHNAPLLP